MTVEEPCPPSVRDGQLRSGFTPILERLIASCVGGIAAMLVDEEGEGVDLAARAGPVRPTGFDIRISGAHWQIVLRQASEQPTLGPIGQLWIRADRAEYVIHGMPYGYVVCIICRLGALDNVSSRALRQAEVELCREACWDIPRPYMPYWRRARVQTDAKGRPSSMRVIPDEEGWSGPATVIEDPSLASRFERTYRVAPVARADADVLLVRERTGFWYATDARLLA